MELTKRFEWDQPIVEAYFPMLDTEVAGKSYPHRPANMKVTDINRPDIDMRFDISDLKRFEERIYEAINKKKALSSKDGEIDLMNAKGIDVLGNMVESSSILTPNVDYYGVLHNYGHLAIGFIHDPEYRYNVLNLPDKFAFIFFLFAYLIINF